MKTWKVGLLDVLGTYYLSKNYAVIPKNFILGQISFPKNFYFYETIFCPVEHKSDHKFTRSPHMDNCLGTTYSE